MARIMQADCTVRMMAAVRQLANMNALQPGGPTRATTLLSIWQPPNHPSEGRSAIIGAAHSLSPSRSIFDLGAPAPFRRIIMGLEVLFEVKGS